MIRKLATQIGDLAAPLRERQFRILWIGQTLSGFGNYLFPVALALLGIARHDGGSGVGILLGARQVGSIVSLPLGGLLGDRFSRTRIMFATDAMRMLCVLALAASAFSASLAGLAAIAAVAGVGEGLFYPAYQAFVPETLPESLRQRGISLTATGTQVAMLLAPGIAAALVIWTSIRWAFLFDGFSFLASAIGTLLLTPAAHDHNGEPDEKLVRQLAGGLAAIIDRRWILAVIVGDAVIICAAYAPLQVVETVVSVHRLGGPGAYSAILIAEGFGALVGGIAVAKASARLRGAKALAALLPTAGAMALLSVPVPLAGVCAAMVVAGAGQAAFGVSWSNAIQEQIPMSLLSRVISIDWFISISLAPLGLFAAGPVAAAIGNRWLLLGGAGVLTCCVALLLTSRDVRHFASRPALAAPGHEEVRQDHGG